MSNDKILEENHREIINYYVKKAYNSKLELHDLRQTIWCTYVKAILDETHFQQA